MRFVATKRVWNEQCALAREDVGEVYRAPGLAASTGRIHIRSRPPAIDASNLLPDGGRPYMTTDGAAM